MRMLEHILPAWANQDIGALGGRMVSALGGKSRSGAARGEESGEELTLAVAVSDVGYSWALVNRQGETVRSRRSWRCVPHKEAEPTAALAQAVAEEADGQPVLRDNLRSILLLTDDPELHITDHRAARLTNFEPRALRQYGAQQAGGRPVVFNSRAFGQTGAKEAERRVLAYLPEEKLQTLFFPLGERATALSAAAPAAAVALASAPDQGVTMTLRVHGYFSTLMIACPSSGALAARHIPLGALTAARAYGDAHGVTLEQACEALAQRPRLGAAEAALTEPVSDEWRTEGFLALRPFLRDLHAEIAATIDYYQYERFAGRPDRLSLAFTGPEISGLDVWLVEAFQTAVELEKDDPASALAAQSAREMNLLEGSPAGMLTLGKEPYQFENGAFRPVEGVKPKAAQRTAAAEGPMAKLSGMMTRAGGKEAAAKSGRPAWLGPAFLAVAAPALLVFANLNYLVGPADQALEREARAYAAASSDQGAAVLTAPAAAAAYDPFWADNVASVGNALLPAMRLTAVRLTGGAEGEHVLEIDGALPEQAGGDLRLVAGFIDRLSKDESFAQRFPRVEFAGVGQSEDDEQPGAGFRVIALGEGGE